MRTLTERTRALPPHPTRSPIPRTPHIYHHPPAIEKEGRSFTWSTDGVDRRFFSRCPSPQESGLTGDWPPLMKHAKHNASMITNFCFYESLVSACVFCMYLSTRRSLVDKLGRPERIKTVARSSRPIYSFARSEKMRRQKSSVNFVLV